MDGGLGGESAVNVDRVVISKRAALRSVAKHSERIVSRQISDECMSRWSQSAHHLVIEQEQALHFLKPISFILRERSTWVKDILIEKQLE